MQLSKHKGVAAHRPLAENYQAAGQDIRALDSHHHRDRSPADTQIVVRPQTDALAAMYVHGVVGDGPGDLGAVVLEYGGGDGRLLAGVHCSDGDGSRRVRDVGAAGHSGDDLLDTFETADGHAELLADPRIGASREQAGLRPAGGIGG